jgi:prepilin signal peptidase PulO-like enzyme (type II secretory pathway)
MDFASNAFSDSFPLRLFSGVLLGLILGSFATMLAYRVPRGLSIVFPRSHCPACKTTLGPRDLVPVFSWLFLRGRCRHCGAPIGARYVIAEIATTILCALATVAFGFSWELLATYALIVAGVAAISALRISSS